ncbi:Crp/Fnr family transcriptional regulator [Emticicia sp. BO119]|uniref:Crp/Fnr family transcriptional regulator n=1 Tax=Emticicia sp. BO119 TaxID=2757768 RepID=UPI0015EFFC92|nr:Crp/Fnr family transcriptional regulator [Emticicia sp. BO119]MBA4850056.1 Crp/Fnr family transcriptional regulator [Emticicia sp. BO119]
MTELEKYINSYFGVEQEDLMLISSLFIHQTLKKGDFYLRTGRHCEKLSFIKSGMLRIYITTEDREVTQWISTQGYFITDLSSLVFDSPARWTIQALTDVELYTIRKDDYNQIGNKISKWHLLEKLFIAKCFTMLEDRIFSHLSMTAEERYNFFFKQNRELFNQVPLQYIASMLGMTPETFSRIRRKAIS